MVSTPRQHQRNPFRPTPGVEPPYLVGRDAELSLLTVGLSATADHDPATPIVITGQRGMGKTVLLRRAIADAKERGGIVIAAEGRPRDFLTGRVRDGLEAAQRSAAPIPDRVRRSIDSVIRALPKPEFTLPHDAGSIGLSEPEPPEAKRFTVELRELNDQIRKRDRFLAFVIDEIQEAPVDELRTLIEFIHESGGTDAPALMIGAGLSNARTQLHQARTYTERWRYLSIGLLTPDETREAIRKPIVDAAHQITDDALEALVAESAGYPYFIQEYASAVWAHHPQTEITMGDVTAVAAGVRRGLEASLYDEAFRSLSPRECRYVLTLAELGTGPHALHEVADALGTRSDQISSIRTQLLKKSILFVPAAGLVDFRIPLTERYIAEHRDELERRSRMAAKTKLDRTLPSSERGRSR